MGYRVGRVCYDTQQQATDVVMSQVLPTITADGSLMLPVYQSPGQWQYAGQTVQLSLPQCDPQEYMTAGFEISKIVIVGLAVVYGVRLIKKMIERAGLEDERE
uniref:Uncharacterized protein n=1 Tax=Dulem virus 54 TaxID=3145765 RepID=A0AAU8B4H3_9VIRU